MSALTLHPGDSTLRDGGGSADEDVEMSDKEKEKCDDLQERG